MPEHAWTLTDVARGVYVPEFLLAPGAGSVEPAAGQFFPGNSAWSVRKRTLRGGVSDGVDVVDVHNGKLQFSLLPTRGMGLWQGSFEGLPIGWKSPVALPVHPFFVNQLDRGGLGWLAGYNEWMSRCGLDSNGAPGNDVVPNNQGDPTSTPLTLHGKIANTPAHQVSVAVTPGANGKISVTGVVEETMLFGPCLRLTSTTETTPNSNTLTIIDEVTNLRGVPGELELLYHINFGPPFLEKDSQLVAPIVEVAPRNARAVEGIGTYGVYEGPTAGYVEQVYWYDLLARPSGETLVLLKNAHGDKGVSLHFNKQQLPCFTLWKNTQAEADGYVTGLEPATNYPNLKTFERKQGRVVVLKPGESYQLRVDIKIHHTADGVGKIEEQIQELQKTKKAVVHQRPHAKYTDIDG